MNLAAKFNESFRSSEGADFSLGMIAADSYGSNSFCYDQLARLQKPAND
jgi:hypothetical protein